MVLIAREGDQAPGAAPGILLGDLTDLGSTLGMQVNRQGQVAFSAPVTGPGISSNNDHGLWFSDLSGRLRLLAREGDLFDVDDNPSVENWRTINLLQLEPFSSGDEDGSTSSFNAAGQLTFILNFGTGGAGVFVANTAVPEPSSLVIIGAAAVAIPLIRKGRLIATVR